MSGGMPLELQPGKTAVEVAKLAELPLVIATIIEAVAAGELDGAMAQKAKRGQAAAEKAGRTFERKARGTYIER